MDELEKLLARHREEKRKVKFEIMANDAVTGEKICSASLLLLDGKAYQMRDHLIIGDTLAMGSLRELQVDSVRISPFTEAAT